MNTTSNHWISPRPWWQNVTARHTRKMRMATLNSYVIRSGLPSYLRGPMSCDLSRQRWQNYINEKKFFSTFPLLMVSTWGSYFGWHVISRLTENGDLAINFGTNGFLLMEYIELVFRLSNFLFKNNVYVCVYTILTCPWYRYLLNYLMTIKK